MLKIVIPNADRSDHTPWASFVLPAKAVHQNQYGKGLPILTSRAIQSKLRAQVRNLKKISISEVTV